MGQKRCLEYNSLLKQLFNGLLLLALPIVTGITMLSRAIILLIAGKSSPYLSKLVFWLAQANEPLSPRLQSRVVDMG